MTWKKQQPEPFDPMLVADSIADVTSTVTGLKASIMSEGFTEEQARRIVVSVMEMAAAEGKK